MLVKNCKSLYLMVFLMVSTHLTWGQHEENVLRELLLGTAEEHVSLNTEVDIIRRTPGLVPFYLETNFNPAWQDEATVNELLFEIHASSFEGLEPKDYYLDRISPYLDREPSDTERAVLDIYLTAAFLKLAEDLHEGKTNPQLLYPGSWEPCIESLDYGRLLIEALDVAGVYMTIESIKPQDRAYQRLKHSLTEMRRIAAGPGLSKFQPGPAIYSGDIDDRIPAIRARLAQLNLMSVQDIDQSTVYDSALFRAVTHFQQLHGLRADGVIGQQTQLALSLTAGQYIDRILVNLERFRWHQSQLVDRSIKINIPAFELELSDEFSVYLRTKAIVGRADRKTPVLSSAVTMLILNPTWTIPPTILKEDVLPAVKADVGYLKTHNIRILNSRGIEVSPDSLPWQSYSADNFPFTLRGDPGPRNPLGFIKFYFPNNHTIYVHDTNVHSLFKESERSFSSGCVRIESPMALARMLFDGTRVTEEKIRSLIESGETTFIPLDDPMPIHLVYFTAWTNSAGQLQMSKDIYGYDPILLEALRAE